MSGYWAMIDLLILYLAQFVVMLRALTRPNRDPAARIAWMLVIFAIPGLGILLYAFLGEVSFGRAAVKRMRTVIAGLPVQPQIVSPVAPRALPGGSRAAFARAAAVNGFSPVSGNRMVLAPDSDAAIDGMVADIDAARETVHVLFYIWLDDTNGGKIMDALARAARRGVTCRAMVDGLGSREVLRTGGWQALEAAGVRTCSAFDTRWPTLRMMVGRIDIRNHRKITVIDGQVAWVGSQNCADAAFLPKAAFGPWVDIMMRVDGPVAWQMQQLFVADWMSHTGEDIAAVLDRPVAAHADGHPAIAFGSGPDLSQNAVPDTIIQVAASALDEIVVTTPYYVPSSPVQDILRSTARRGVKVRLILPAVNDNRFVAAASRSYYAGLLHAGVRIFEHGPGLLHSKTLTVDGRMAMIGSANLDRRSFDLNFENNMLLAGAGPLAAIRARQLSYLGQSREVTLDEVRAWRWTRRLVHNLAATFSPVL